jgi:hypothetical protein
MSTLYKHRIYCLVTGGWAYKWTEDQTPLTTCPDDPAHPVQAGSEAIIDEKSDGTIIVNKEPGVVTHGNVRVDTVVLNAGAGASASVTKAHRSRLTQRLSQCGGSPTGGQRQPGGQPLTRDPLALGVAGICPADIFQSTAETFTYIP